MKYAHQALLDSFRSTPSPAGGGRAAPSGSAAETIVALLPGVALEGLVGRVVAHAKALLQDVDHLYEDMPRASEDLSRGTGQVAGAVVQNASEAQAAQGILSNARREATAIVERAHRQAEDVLSAAHHEADYFLQGALLPEVSRLLVRESAVALSERMVEEERLHVQEREGNLAKKEAELSSREMVVTLREAGAARELERLEIMEIQITKTQELLDNRKVKLDQFEARVSRRLDEERRDNAQKLTDECKLLHADYCKRTQ
jgi:cell division septum initiation protein DivIVA